MTVIYPQATPAQGNTSVTAVLTIADQAAPSLASEINVASSVDVSCYIYGNFDASANTNKGTAPARLCTTSQLEQLGNTTYTIADLQYVYDPQADDTTDENKAKATLTEGTVLYLVERNGLSARDSAYAQGQVVNVHKVRLGPQVRTKTGDDEFAEYSITQSLVYVEEPTYDSTIAA